MKSPSPLLLAVGFAAVLASDSLMAQTNITWGSLGLPPGLSLVTNNVPAGTVRVTGTPTTAGVYSARIYPIVNGVFGDMNEVNFRILPAGVNLPTFYGYQRGVAVKDGQLTAVGGGGRLIMASVWNGDNRVTYTSNGQTFSSLRNPPTGSLVAAATAGSSHALAIYSSHSTGSNSAQYSTNESSFTSGLLPPEAATNGGLLGLANYGSGYLLAAATPGSPWSIPPVSPSIRLWRGSAVLTPTPNATWSGLGTFNLASAPFMAGNLSISTAARTGTSPVNLISVASTSYGTPTPIALLRSTNNGTSWSNTSSPSPALISVAYDTVNQQFVGSANDGVYTSPTGAAPWTRRSTEQVGAVLYSTFHKLLFSSANGVSRDGASWMPYAELVRGGGPFGFSMLTANSNGSIVFLNSSQLSTTYVPTAFSRSQVGRVGTAFTYQIQAD